LRIPAGLAEHWRRDQEWLDALPRLVAECAAAWDLELEQPYETPGSLVVPASGAVLKLNAPAHIEAEHEADALACWDGAGAVQLLARDDDRRALLLERCVPGTTLVASGADETAVVPGLLERLRRTPRPGHPYRLLVDQARRWAVELPERFERGGRPFERSLLDAALDVFDTVDPRADRLVNQDVHGWNVLRAQREPWLVIDPKPVVGEPELDGVGLLRNAGFRGSRDDIRRWLDILVGLGLDRERLRGWGFAHALAWGVEPDGRWSERSIAAARAISCA
jgi:streptomycin 6-kinase